MKRIGGGHGDHADGQIIQVLTVQHVQSCFQILFDNPVHLKSEWKVEVPCWSL